MNHKTPVARCEACRKLYYTEPGKTGLRPCPCGASVSLNPKHDQLRNELPESLRSGTLAYKFLSGNPPHSPIGYGWVLRLGRHTSDEEKGWLKKNGFAFHGGKWIKNDTSDARCCARSDKTGRVDIALMWSWSDHNGRVHWSPRKNSYVIIRDDNGPWVLPGGLLVRLLSINGIGEIRWDVSPAMAKDAAAEYTGAVLFFELEETP